MAGQTGKRTGNRRSRSKVVHQRETFLAHFAANCNVVAAAAAAGVSAQTLYDWRRDDDDFAEAWAGALAMGYQLLESRLLAHALAGAQGGDMDGIAPIGAEPIHVELALKLMGLHRHSSTKGFPGGRLKPVAREDMLKVLLERIEHVEKRKKLAAERDAREAAAREAARAGPVALIEQAPEPGA